jgi:uncharacterized protein
MDRYVLTAAQFDSLAAGAGSPDALDVLRAGQLAKRKLLLGAVAREAGGAAKPVFDVAAALLLEVERVDPAAVDDVLALPHVDAWATDCLSDPTDPVRMGHLAALAASAASRAGIPFTIDAPARPGRVCLPGFGLTLGPGPLSPDTNVELLRRLDLEPGFTVSIEDQDPYRDCYGSEPASTGSAASLEKLLPDAWEIIRSRHPAHADAIAGGLQAIVPLRPSPDGASISAASRQAAGSVALAVPPTAEELALLLIHEDQHARLGALYDIVDLFRPDARGRFHAPWRLDPRPTGQLLQGVYAHLGVILYWRQRWLASGERLAAVEFAYWLEQTRMAAATLAAGGELTPPGERFVKGIQSTLAACGDVEVPADIRVGVQRMVLAQTVRWRLENWEPFPGEVEAWRSGGSAAVGIAAAGRLRPADRARPAGLPGIVAALHASLVGVPHPPADPADGALVAGDLSAAALGYAERMAVDPVDVDAWVGFALTGAGSPHSAEDVVRRPDVLVRLTVSKT